MNGRTEQVRTATDSLAGLKLQLTVLNTPSDQ